MTCSDWTCGDGWLWNLKLRLVVGFLSFHIHLTVITDTQEDSKTIKTYPSNIKLNNQAKKDDVCDRSREKCIYMPLAEVKQAYVRDC
jgi:hypothetical protein